MVEFFYFANVVKKSFPFVFVMGLPSKHFPVSYCNIVFTGQYTLPKIQCNICEKKVLNGCPYLGFIFKKKRIKSFNKDKMGRIMLGLRLGISHKYTVN